MSGKVKIKTIKDFYSTKGEFKYLFEVKYLFERDLEQMKNPEYNAGSILFEILDFLYDDRESPNYAEVLGDEVKAHCTKIALKAYRECKHLHSGGPINILKKEQLANLYKDYYEASLTLDDFQENSVKIRNEIEKLKSEINDG